MSLDILYTHILNIIISKCRVEDRINIACICKKFREVIESNKYFNILSINKIDKIHFLANENKKNNIMEDIEKKYPNLICNRVIKFASMRSNRCLIKLLDKNDEFGKSENVSGYESDLYRYFKK